MSQGFFDELSSKDVSGDISLLRTLVETLPDHVYVKDAEGRYVLNNLAHARALGISNPEEIAGKSDFDLYPEELAERYRADEQKIIRSGGRFSINKEQPGVDGEGNKKWHSTFKVPLRNNNGQIAGFLGVTRDVTEQKEAEEALRRSEAKFRSVVHNSTEIVKIVDVDGTLRYASPAFERVLGYSPEEAAGINVLDHVHPDDLPHVLEETEKALGEAGVGRNVVEYRFRHKDGSWRHMESVGTYLLDDPAVRGVVVNVRDVTERKEMEERLRHQAFHDSLTDLPNRILFLDRLEHALARAGREGGPVAVLFADLDDFKGVNDSLGHDAGNAVLVEVAERLRNHIRPGDTVGRIFGDEFAVLLEAPAGVEEARQVTERIQKSLQAPFNAGRYEVFMRASIGIAFGETIEDEPKEVLRHADLAMYEVKNSGKARYEVYDPSMDTRAVERMDLDKSLRRAMEHEEFEVHYQPKVRLATGATVGVEALVRWRHPDKGLLLPAQFIPHAEETGLMEQIGLWVLKESCRQIKEWQERYPEKLAPSFDLCANLSAKEIQQPDLAEKVAGVLHEAGLDPRCLMIEISERTAMEDAEQTIGKLRELKDLGVKLAIDDFGTGYCSLVYLEHSLLDVLKIDRMLIHRKREKWEECVQIVSAMTSMAQALGLEVVVEGVETEDQLAELKKMGCEMAQGFYFARPLPSEAVERLLVEGGYWQ